MDIDGFDHLARQAGGVHLVDIGLDLFLRPHLARGLVIQKAHQARHAGDLLNLLQRYAVAV